MGILSFEFGVKLGGLKIRFIYFVLNINLIFISRVTPSITIVLRAPRKTPIYPSLLVRKTPDSFGEKGSDEAKKRTVFRDALNSNNLSLTVN